MIVSASLLLLSLSAYQGENTDEGQVLACIQACQAYADEPGFDLKGCVLKCQELAQP